MRRTVVLIASAVIDASTIPTVASECTSSKDIDVVIRAAPQEVFTDASDRCTAGSGLVRGTAQSVSDFVSVLRNLEMTPRFVCFEGLSAKQRFLSNSSGMIKIALGVYDTSGQLQAPHREWLAFERRKPSHRSVPPLDARRLLAFD